MAAVEVDMEAPNPARTTALVVSSIAMDSGVSIFASQKGFSSTGEEIENVKIGIGVLRHHQESQLVYLAGRLIWRWREDGWGATRGTTQSEFSTEKLHIKKKFNTLLEWGDQEEHFVIVFVVVGLV